MIRNLLDQIRQFYQDYAPVACAPEQVIAPASESDLAQFEVQLQAALPPDYREFLLYNDLRHNFNMNYECLDLAGVRRRWQLMKDLLEQGRFDDGRIEYHRQNGFGNWDGGYLQEVWWHPQWVPFAEDSCGNMLCLDGAPGPNGHPYQLIYMEVQDGQGPFIADYDSFTDYLASHLQYLRNGQYEVYEWGIEIDRLLPVRRGH